MSNDLESLTYEKSDPDYTEGQVTKHEKRALQNLKNNQQIFIRSADGGGGGIVV